MALRSISWLKVKVMGEINLVRIKIPKLFTISENRLRIKNKRTIYGLISFRYGNQLLNTMTYKELLQTLADKASENYKDYLQSKIDALVNADDSLLPEKTQQYKDECERYEKKFSAALATVKNVQGLDESVAESDIDNFL
jgi:hypothetical protein